jgi:hypothetical protein
LQDLGYVKAIVNEPAFSFTTNRRERIVNVTVVVDEGTQHRLASIQFQDEKLFPADQLRKAFALQDGDLFNATKFGSGLQNLQNLYQEAGYINFVATPQLERNDFSRTVDFVIDVDEGKQFSFGHLVLDGLEPHVGAGYALLNSWKTLQGKQYSPAVLHQWLVANRSDWQGTHKSQPISALCCGNPIETMPEAESGVVNVKLSFPRIRPLGLN